MRVGRKHVFQYGSIVIDETTKATVTELLARMQDGDDSVVDELFGKVYETLRELAHHHRQAWQGDFTLNTTAIVHEAYLKLVDNQGAEWESQSQWVRSFLQLQPSKDLMMLRCP